MIWLLPCYLLLRPLCTLLPELCRALLMLGWSRRQAVDIHLGSQGHDRGWSFRIGRLRFRVHAYVFVLRGSISDTLALPSTRQFVLWNASSLLCSALIVGVCLFLILGRHVPDAVLPLLGVAALLAFTDLGFGIFRESDPICMRCGLVHSGPGPALQTIFRYRGAGIDFLRGVRHYLRDDYKAALNAYQSVLARGRHSEDLLEDIQYAQMALGDYVGAAATFDRLVADYVPSATQLAVAAYVSWRLGDPTQAFIHADAAIHTASAQPVARNYRAWLYLEIGNARAAVADLDVALASSAEYACAHGNRAQAFLELGRLQEARADILLALQLDPLDLELLRIGTAVLQATGEAALAAVLQARAALIAPSYPIHP
jgi:tetratricopeptide (TPR) repeat protein